MHTPIHCSGFSVSSKSSSMKWDWNLYALSYTEGVPSLSIIVGCRIKLEHQVKGQGRCIYFVVFYPYPLSVTAGSQTCATKDRSRDVLFPPLLPVEPDLDTRWKVKEDVALRCSILFLYRWLENRTWTPGDSCRSWPTDPMLRSQFCHRSPQGSRENKSTL